MSKLIVVIASFFGAAYIAGKFDSLQTPVFDLFSVPVTGVMLAAMFVAILASGMKTK